MLSKVKYVIVISSLFCIFTSMPLLAGKYEDNLEYEKYILHPEITYERIAGIERLINEKIGDNKELIKQLKSFNKKMVFWYGRVKFVYKVLDKYLLCLELADGNVITVVTDRALPFDRLGYLIGVKGRVVIRENEFVCLDLWSHLPIRPPIAWNYYDFVNELSLSSKFIYKDKEVENDFFPLLCWWIHFYNPKLANDRLISIASAIIYYSQYYSVDPFWAAALFSVESAYRVEVISPSGAIGLGQLMPSTARSLGVNPYIPEQNIAGALKYFSQQLKHWNKYDDKISRALASYNAGPGAVSYYNGIPPYSETQNYVFFIKFLHSQIINQFEEVNN